MLPFPQKKDEEPVVESRKPGTDELREYRIARYRDDLRFLQGESEKLADSHMSNGFFLDWHFVERALKNGLSHRKVLDLLVDL